MGKTPIAVNESPGFAVNRILIPMINEAIFVLQEGVASAEDIDKGMMLGANHPIGPLALADLVGLDTLLMIQENLCYGQVPPCRFAKMVEPVLGPKKCRFYEYSKWFDCPGFVDRKEVGPNRGVKVIE
jgi:3-hydroxyacyl-CoA dehydrogenase